MTENGHAQIDSTYVHVETLVPNEWNPNQQSEIVRRAERESILAYGFIDPITVRPHPTQADKYEIIDGEHRWEMAREIGLELVPVVTLELDDAAARKLTVVLNETRGDADAVLLGQLLTDLQGMMDADAFAVALPYTGAELEHLLSIGAQEWDQFDPGGTANPVLPGSNLREVTLTMEPKTYDQFVRWVEILRKEWALGEAGITELVVEAVRRCALEANQGTN